MCGLAGLIYRDGDAAVGREMVKMLQALKHRGPDSTGLALYGKNSGDDVVLRIKFAEQADLEGGFDIFDRLRERKAAVESRLQEYEVKIASIDEVTPYVSRVRCAPPRMRKND